MKIVRLIISSLLIVFIGCADSHPFLSGYIKRAQDGLLTTCDPYNKGVKRSCVIYAPTFGDSLVIYNASDKEMVLAPNPYFPLLVPVDKGTHALAEAKAVDSQENSVEFFFALNGAQKKLYVVRTKPDQEKSKVSFSKPIEHDATAASYKIAGFYHDNHYFALITIPDAGQVGILALTSDGSLLDNGYRAINVGVRPSHIAVDAVKAVAVISDEGALQLAVLELDDLISVAQNRKVPVVRNIPIGMNSEKLSLSLNDLGSGTNLYAIVSEMAGRRISLVDVSNNRALTSIQASDYVTALYLPQEKNEPCCNKKEHWFQYTTAKGQLNYVLVSDAFALLERDPIDLSSKDNIGVSNLWVNAIVGGPILPGNKKSDKKECPRKVFYLTSFAANKIDGRQIEAQAFSCEGEEGAYPMGDEERTSKSRRERSLLRE